jgi:hypothetical protein
VSFDQDKGNRELQDVDAAFDSYAINAQKEVPTKSAHNERALP